MSRLRGLDERWVPEAARRLRGLTDRLGVLGKRVADARSRPRAEPAEVRPARQPARERPSLRDLDDRYARTGPLGLFREIPQVGFIVVGLVFLAATGTAVSRQAASTRANSQDTVTVPTGSGSPGAAGSSSLGPQPGDTVATYLAAASAELAQADRADSGKARVSLVSLSAFQNQEQAVATLAGIEVLEVFLRSNAGGKEATELGVPVSGPFAASLKKSYADAAQGRRDAQKSYQGYVDTLTVTTKEDRQFKDYYLMFARSTGAEAAAYDHDCACVYSIVVMASPKQLLKLKARKGVRSVQVAGQGLTLRDVQVYPLLPSVTGTVLEQQTASPP